MIEMKRQLILQISLSKIMKKRNIDLKKIKASKNFINFILNSTHRLKFHIFSFNLSINVSHDLENVRRVIDRSKARSGFPANSMFRLINAVQGLMKRLLNKLSPRRLI